MTNAKRTSGKPANKLESKPFKPVSYASHPVYVDLSKLRKTSLKRYKKHFNLDVKAESKTELLEAVGKHFATMPVEETQVAIQFYNFIRSRNTNKRVVSSGVLDPVNMNMNMTLSNNRPTSTSQPSAIVSNPPPLPSTLSKSALIQTRPNPNQNHHHNSSNHQPSSTTPATHKNHVQQQQQHAPAAASGSAR